MEKELELKINMLNAVQFTLRTNSDITSLHPELMESVNFLSEYINNLSNNSQLQKTGMLGRNHSSFSPEEHLKNNLSKIVLSLNSFASMVENVEIMTETSFLKYHLDDLHGYDLLAKAQKILDLAVSNFMSLIHFGIYEDLISSFNFSIRKYEDSLKEENNPTYYQEDEDAESQINEICSFLENTVDKQMQNLRLLYPRFYNEYQNSRLSGQSIKSDYSEQISFDYFY